MARNPVVTLTDDNGTSLGTPGNPFTTAPTSATSTLLNQASGAQVASGNSGSLATGGVSKLAIDVNLTALTGGTAPTVTFFLDRQGVDGVWYRVWTSTAQTVAGVVSTSVGDGCTITAVLTAACRLGWLFGGTVSPTSVTFSASVVGRP